MSVLDRVAWRECECPLYLIHATATPDERPRESRLSVRKALKNGSLLVSTFHSNKHEQRARVIKATWGGERSETGGPVHQNLRTQRGWYTRRCARNAASASSGEVVLYGSPGTRSPLVDWYLHELNQPFEPRPPRDPSNPHPFGQVPALRDEDGVELFESGAILMYIADKYGGVDTPEQRALVGKWVMWANATLDSLLFIETPEGRVIDTGVRRPTKIMDTLDQLLAGQEYLLGSNFSVADVAVGSYLLYVPQFFPDVSLSKYTNVIRYMLSLAEREAYGKAYGQAAIGVRAKCQMYIDGMPMRKKLFGIF
ncbi:glutathione S-transferase [Cymbomonas tetramitiformis]|uniref:Glutathione S-transferase n=1 Tax=Cymbomonas tetramitiformis TaxID=36881 RepID=A0AAE0EYS8_9CHLO|nr:glutathione S-transferase [Cymbomonas tetramitiformis]